MKINNFYNRNNNERTRRVKKTTSGVTQLIDSQTIIKLTKELEEQKNKLQLSQQLLETETQKHLKELLKKVKYILKSLDIKIMFH